MSEVNPVQQRHLLEAQRSTGWGRRYLEAREQHLFDDFILSDDRRSDFAQQALAR